MKLASTQSSAIRIGLLICLLFGFEASHRDAFSQVLGQFKGIKIPRIPIFNPDPPTPPPGTNALSDPSQSLNPFSDITKQFTNFMALGNGNIRWFELPIGGTNSQVVQFQKPEQLLVTPRGGSFFDRLQKTVMSFGSKGGQDPATLKALNLPNWQFQGHDPKEDDIKVEVFKPLSDSENENRALVDNAPEKDAVLHRYRVGLWELRRGNVAEAVSHFEKALDVVDNRFGKDRNAARGRNYFHEESDKTFVGEPHERAMANIYLGYAYLMQGKTEPARACFKNAAWEDSWEASSETNRQYQSDFVLPYYIRGMLSAPSEAALQYQEATNSCAVYSAPPPYESSNNALVLADYGNGPKKYTAGKDQRELHYEDGFTEVAEVRVYGKGVDARAKTYDDVTFQALTRGGRVMDHINARKSKTKTVSKYGGWGLALAGAGLALAGGHEYVAAGLMVGGWLVETVGHYIKPKADARYWDNLPACLTAIPISLPPGTHQLTVEFLDRSGKKIDDSKITLRVEDGKTAAGYASHNPKLKEEARYASR